MNKNYLIFGAHLMLIFSIIEYTFGAEYMKTKANFIKTCQIKDPKFLACSTQGNQILYKTLASGIEGLEDLPFDPMKVSKIQVLGNGGPVSVNTVITKAIITGLTNMVVDEADVNPVDFSWRNKLYIPKMRIEGNYRMKGRILVVPLNGHGKCWIEPRGMHIAAHIKTRLYEKFNHVFYNITAATVDFSISELQLHFSNLFDGATALEDGTNQYLNENWRPVAESLKPIIAQSIEAIFIETLNKLFSFIPADYFISDIPHPSELYGTS